jgi:hypothetical protein
MHLLAEFHVSDKVFTAFDALRKEDVACAGDRDNVRVFAERLERNRVVNLARTLLGVVQGDEVGRRERFFRDRVRVVVLPTRVSGRRCS